MWLLSDRDAEIERLREAAAELSEQLAEARREIEIVLARENAALKMALAHERKQHAAAKAAPASQELIEARATIEGLLKRVRELEEKLVFERLHKPAAAKTKAAKPAPDDPRIAGLMKANRELRAKLRRMHQFYEDESSRKGIMTFSTYGKLMKCLHPDSKRATRNAAKRVACSVNGNRARTGHATTPKADRRASPRALPARARRRAAPWSCDRMRHVLTYDPGERSQNLTGGNMHGPPCDSEAEIVMLKSSVMAFPCELVEGCDELLSAPFHAAPSKWKLGKSKRAAR